MNSTYSGDIAATYTVFGKTFASKDEAIAYKIRCDRETAAKDYLEQHIKRRQGAYGATINEVVTLISKHLEHFDQALKILHGRAARCQTKVAAGAESKPMDALRTSNLDLHLANKLRHCWAQPLFATRGLAQSASAVWRASEPPKTAGDYRLTRWLSVAKSAGCNRAKACEGSHDCHYST